MLTRHKGRKLVVVALIGGAWYFAICVGQAMDILEREKR